jgi:ABC-type sulfate/molybdate transport systems ATPase subunit
VSGLAVHLAGRPVLTGLDLELAPGELVLVVGRSGSGKSTLLRTMAGLERVTAGTIELDGRVVDDGPRRVVRPAARAVGMVFQGGALWPHMSVRRTLEFVLGARGVPRSDRRARADELVALCELAGLEERKPGTLSGGEAQRLALARALAMQPRLLLLVEPLGPLDAELRRTLLERVVDVHRRLGLATIHVTHDPDEAAGDAVRVLRLEGGRLVDERTSAGREVPR